MDYDVPTQERPVRGPHAVPPSKSLHQRMLVLDHLADAPAGFEDSAGLQAPADDVQRLGAALQQLGRWEAGALGRGRVSQKLDFGAGATGFRFGLAAATLRPDGARSLCRGRAQLLGRPHGPLVRALQRLGARIKRRQSGALRVLGGRMRGAELPLDAGLSSQFASALLLVAPRIGGLRLKLCGRPASLPYLRLTLDVLSRFGVPWEADGLDGDAGWIQVAAAAPRARRLRLEPDASCAAAWWAAAALTGGEAWIPGLGRGSGQADVALLEVLERMGADVREDAQGAARVRGTGARMVAPGDVDLHDSPDLIFLVGILGALAHGTTRISGVTHTRGKESDRIAVLVRGLERLGADVRVAADDSIHIGGGTLHGSTVAVSGDHRAAFAFGVLGLVVSGVRLRGAEAVEKSHPRFLDDLGHLAVRSADPRSHG